MLLLYSMGRANTLAQAKLGRGTIESKDGAESAASASFPSSGHNLVQPTRFNRERVSDYDFTCGISA